jgi:hypothetical protein
MYDYGSGSNISCVVVGTNAVSAEVRADDVA